MHPNNPKLQPVQQISKNNIDDSVDDGDSLRSSFIAGSSRSVANDGVG